MKCNTCKYRDQNANDYPCNKCKHTSTFFEAALLNRKVLWEPRQDDNTDVVNHPAHYESGKFECIDVMLETQGTFAVQAFCICNAFKYLYRHNKKNGTEDIKKAVWYLNKFLELEGATNDQN